MVVKADFHIHSCLSPCGSLEMSPIAIVKKAIEKDLNLIAISDHNSAKNCPVLSRICALEGLHCFFGIEVSTIEEVHSLCIFDNLDTVMEFDRFIYEHLPDIQNMPEKFGDQVVVNEKDEIIEVIDKYLGSACDISIDNLNLLVLEMGGLFIPAHINRAVFSLQSQLGFVPEKEPYSAVEVYRTSFLNGQPSVPVTDYPVVSNSDAHYLEQIGSIWNEFDINEYNLKNICRALSAKKNRVMY